MIDTEVDFIAKEDQVFTGVFYDVRRSNTRFVVVYGGAGSGKSYAVHQLELLNIMQPGTGDVLFIRKHGADLRDSCYKLLLKLMDDWDLRLAFKCRFSNDQRRITCNATGRSIILRGVDDAEKLKSIVGIKRIVIEEASQLTFEDFLELNRRARGMEDIQIIFILNPVSENHWIKTRFCDTTGPYHAATTVLRFTYHDNCTRSGKRFLTNADITELERLKHIDENQYRIYVLAEWGIDNTDGKFCWAFSRAHIYPTAYDPGLCLWASFDFNIDPLTCTLAQVLPEVSTVRAIECIKLESSDIWKMCARLKASYPQAMWQVTGDASGQSRTALARDNTTYFKVIEQELGLTLQQIYVPPVNPRIEENRLLVNALHRNWTVQIDPDRCQPLIYDLQYVEVNALNKIKKNRTSPTRYADFLDTWRYLINSAVREWMF